MEQWSAAGIHGITIIGSVFTKTKNCGFNPKCVVFQVSTNVAQLIFVEIGRLGSAINPFL